MEFVGVGGIHPNEARLGLLVHLEMRNTRTQAFTFDEHAIKLNKHTKKTERIHRIDILLSNQQLLRCPIIGIRLDKDNRKLRPTCRQPHLSSNSRIRRSEVLEQNPR